MKLKHLAVAVAVLAFVALLAYLAAPPATTSGLAHDPRLGQPLIEPSAIAQATRIEISKKDAQGPLVVEQDKTGAWIVLSYFDLPADFSKLTDLTGKLTEAKIDRRVTADPEALQRLELGQSQVVFKDAAGKTLAEIRVGKPGTSGGTFVQTGDAKNPAYLTTESLFIDTLPENWSNRTPFEINPEDVKEVTLQLKGEKEPVTFARGAKGEPFQSPSTPEGKEVNTQELDTLIRTATTQRFTKALEAKAPEAEAAAANVLGTLTIQPFEGEAWTLAFRQEPAKPAAPEPKPDKKKKKKKGQEAEAAPAPAPTPEPPKPVMVIWERRGLSETEEALALEFPSYFANQWPTTPASLFKDKAPTPPPASEAPSSPSDSAAPKTGPVSVTTPPLTVPAAAEKKTK